jgi:peptide/nickel transport system permease protein
MSLAEIEVAQLELDAPTGGLWSDSFSRLRRNPGAVAGFIVVAIFVLVAIFAPLLAQHSPSFSDITLLEKPTCCTPPNSHHWLGADKLGRDEFARIVYGARYSLLISLAAVFTGLVVGLPLGSIAGFFGGVVDTVIMRTMDVMLAIPGLLLAIGIVAVLGPGFRQITIAVGVTNIPIFARLLRGSVLSQREADFVLAARSVGVRRKGILFSHILPNAVSPLIVQSTLAMATAIIDVAALGFLGLASQDPNVAEWGTMLTDAATHYLVQAPWLTFFPALAIVLLVLSLNLIGDGLREAFDPKLRGRV